MFLIEKTPGFTPEGLAFIIRYNSSEFKGGWKEKKRFSSHIESDLFSVKCLTTTMPVCFHASVICKFPPPFQICLNESVQRHCNDTKWLLLTVNIKVLVL